MLDQLETTERTFDRRKLVMGTVGALAATGVAKTLAWPEDALAQGAPLPPPEPIPGGLPVPEEVRPEEVIHIFLPGPEDVTLPFSQLTLQGLDVEPSTITDFNGFTALAMLTGTASGSDGVDYDFEADIRAYQGRYVAADGRRHSGAFALI